MSRLLWTEGEEEQSWEVQLAKRYHDKLFKEYVIIDLSRSVPSGAMMMLTTSNMHA